MDSLATPPAASATVRVESRAHEWNKPPRKVRAACDRCHSRKLRCTRKPDKAACERCLKLYTSCRFGPRAPRASLRSQQHRAHGDWHEPPSVPVMFPMLNLHSNSAMTHGSSNEVLFSLDVNSSITAEQAMMHPEPHYPIPDDLTDVHNIWPDPSCEPWNPKILDQYGSLDITNQDLFCDISPSPDSPSYSHQRILASPASTVRNLANLNVALYDCATKLPSMPPKVGKSAVDVISHGRSSTRQKTLFTFDELFRLTNEFIDIIKPFSCAAYGSSTVTPPIQDPKPSSLRASSSSSAPPPVACNQHLPYDAGPAIAATATIDSGTPIIPHFDEGTLLMIISCHYRLTDMYLSIFQMMHACITVSIAPPKKKENEDWTIVLPQCQVGSHAVLPPMQVNADTAPLPSSTTSMYMVVITMLASQLCEKIASMMMQMGHQDVSGDGDDGGGGRGRGFRECPGISSPSQLLFTTAVADRADRLRHSINTTKGLLSCFSTVAE